MASSSDGKNGTFGFGHRARVSLTRLGSRKTQPTIVARATCGTISVAQFRPHPPRPICTRRIWLVATTGEALRETRIAVVASPGHSRRTSWTHVLGAYATLAFSRLLGHPRCR